VGSLVGPMGNDEGGSVGATVDWAKGWVVGKDD